MPNYGAWEAIAGGAGKGLADISTSLLAAKKMADEKKLKDLQMSELTPSIPALGILPGAPEGFNLTRGEAAKGLEKRAELAAAAKAKAAVGGTPPGMKLKPGERYIQATDTVEAIPGSDLEVQQRTKHGKEESATKTVSAKADMGIQKVDEILNDPKVLNTQFGGYGAKFVGQYANPNEKIKIESLKSNLKAAGLEIMKNGGGIGAISEAEWPIMEGMIDKLDPTMTKEAAQAALINIKNRFQDMKDRTQAVYDNNWAGSPYQKHKRVAKGGVLTPEAAPTQEPAPANDAAAKEARRQELLAKAAQSQGR